MTVNPKTPSSLACYNVKHNIYDILVRDQCLNNIQCRTYFYVIIIIVAINITSIAKQYLVYSRVVCMIKGPKMPINSMWYNHSNHSATSASRCHFSINGLYMFIDQSKSTGNSMLQNRYSIPLPTHMDYSY